MNSFYKPDLEKIKKMSLSELVAAKSIIDSLYIPAETKTASIIKSMNLRSAINKECDERINNLFL